MAETMIRKHHASIERLAIIAGFLFLIAVFHWLFYVYFPTEQGLLGHDYAYFLPNLLNGVYWFRNNGLFSVPWFTPAFCGGLPFFPNPQNIYYSLPQLLSFFINPLHAVYLSFLLFAATGFAGTYLLLRKVFRLSTPASFLGASIFLFNGFYISRMLIGHLTYQVFMLLPLLAFLLLPERGVTLEPRLIRASRLIIAGTIISYMFYAGAANFIVPIIISLIGIWSLTGIMGKSSFRFWTGLLFSGMFSILLSLAKLYPAILFMSNFGRDYYPLPGFDGLWSTLVNVFKMLFLSIDGSISGKFINFPYYIEQHDFEYGVSFIPLLLVSALLINGFMKLIKQGIGNGPDMHRVYCFVLLVIVLIIPIAFNTHYPQWSSFLKRLPYIENSTSLLRWISIWIPVIVILSAHAVDLLRSRRARMLLATVCVTGIILFNLNADRDFYKGQPYNPADIIAAWYEQTPIISFVGNVPGSQETVIYIERNNLLVAGGSQMFCYEPIFGYGLEYFPVGTLHRGSIMDMNNGYLNLKNPACYVFPEQNSCPVGSHFPASDRARMESFASYRPYSFELSVLQQVFNLASLLALLLSIVSIVYFGYALTAGKKN